MYGERGQVVYKKGFFTSIVTGLFGLLSVLVICASVVGFYAINVADRKASEVLRPTMDTLRGLMTEWRESLPPALADAINDERAPEYREKLAISSRLVTDGDRHRVIVEVKNDGDKLVTLLAGRLVLESTDGDPVRSKGIYAVTPLTLDDPEWRGPLMPGTTRKLMETMWDGDQASAVVFEVTEVRVWTGEPSRYSTERPTTELAVKRGSDRDDDDAARDDDHEARPLARRTARD